MSYDYERYDGKRIVVDGEVIGLLAMEFGHEVEEVWEEYHAELVMTEEQERQSEAYKESLRRTLSAQYEKVATLEAENAKLRELATYALRYIERERCDDPKHELWHGKPCESCAEAGSSDCPKTMAKMFGELGIEVDA